MGAKPPAPVLTVISERKTLPAPTRLVGRKLAKANLRHPYQQKGGDRPRRFPPYVPKPQQPRTLPPTLCRSGRSTTKAFRGGTTAPTQPQPGMGAKPPAPVLTVISERKTLPAPTRLVGRKLAKANLRHPYQQKGGDRPRRFPPYVPKPQQPRTLPPTLCRSGRSTTKAFRGGTTAPTQPQPGMGAKPPAPLLTVISETKTLPAPTRLVGRKLAKANLRHPHQQKGGDRPCRFPPYVPKPQQPRTLPPTPCRSGPSTTKAFRGGNTTPTAGTGCSYLYNYCPATSASTRSATWVA